MGPKEWGRAGGLILRQRYTDEYNKNPNHCLNCGKIIKILDGQKPSSVKKKRFCNRSCSAAYNNAAEPKRKRASHSVCKNCGKEILITRSPSGSYYRRKYCDECLPLILQKNAYKSKKIEIEDGFHNLTKGEVRASSRDSQRMRIKITNHARVVYKRTGKPYRCLACGYSLHVNICHVKDIKDFSDDSLISEINHPDNLITLCPTHHWEFDHGHWDYNIQRSVRSSG